MPHSALDENAVLSVHREEPPITPPNGPSRVVLHAATIFASAFLLFLVEPMVGKRILPWFGGVPTVWTLCLAFYQTTLFLGYAYAHLTIRLVRPRFQVVSHALLLTAAMLSLPVLPQLAPDRSSDLDPTLSVLTILASSVALPFISLASTGPLVQAWFARAHPTVSPYPLYAVSNLASFLALFSYPFLLEPNFRLSETGALWSVGFAATALAVLVCAWQAASSAPVADRALAADERSMESRTGLVPVVLWLMLSGSAVVVLMGITNKLCLDVASIPFLWIVPLATYLTTFVLAFSSEKIYRRTPFVLASLVLLALTWTTDIYTFIVYQVLAYCGLLFCACMILHGELFRSRPAPQGLTLFYLVVSAGGAIGGILAGIVAPRVFDDYYELEVGLVLAAVSLLAVCVRDPRSFLRSDGPRWRRLVATSLTLGLVGFFVWRDTRPDPRVVERERSFFGVLTVRNVSTVEGEMRALINGTTTHGAQFRLEPLSQIPTSYYGRATGLGLALASRAEHEESRIGVIGLGVGTLASYGRAGDSVRFYEIDPVVVRIAESGGQFSFLERSAADVEVVIGDARLSIEDERARGERQVFDWLVLDAFSSDSIPIHLLTREAFEGYFDALAPNGLIAVHVTNRHFRLMGLVSRLATELGAQSLEMRSRPDVRLRSGFSDWVILSRDSERLARVRDRVEGRHRSLGLPRRSLILRPGEGSHSLKFPVWTDDFSDLLSVLRRD